jgi:hypothetical protein
MNFATFPRLKTGDIFLWFFYLKQTICRFVPFTHNGTIEVPGKPEFAYKNFTISILVEALKTIII